MRNPVEDALILLIDLKKIGSLIPGFVDKDIIDCLDCVGNGFNPEEGGFWEGKVDEVECKELGLHFTTARGLGYYASYS